MEATDVLVVGAGLAGGRCAETLRAGGYAGRILVAGDEPHPPYERPALSKELLAGTRDADSLMLRPPAFWAERDVELRLGVRVDEVDPIGRRARVGGTSIRWRHLVLAAGARARRIPGLPEAPNVHHLRSLADARALGADLERGGPLVIVGAGFVGAEVASSARALGVPVTVIEALPVPFLRILGPSVGRRLAHRYRAHGVDLRLGATMERVQAPSGRVREVRLADGTRLDCGALLVAVGAAPVAELLGNRPAPAADGGVPTDPWGRTELPGVFACGDVASPWRPELGAHLRLEHWTGAAAGGAAAARAIMDAALPPPAMPYFWSDQFGWRLQMVGHPPPGSDAEIEERGEGFVGRYRDADGRLCGALAVNRPEDLALLRAELSSSVVPGAGA